MDSVRTAFRLLIMLAALAIAYKAWHQYGPPADQLKSIALRALDAARATLADSGGKTSSAAIAVDPRPIAPVFLPPAPQPIPESSGQVVQAQALVPSDGPAIGAPIVAPKLAPLPSLVPANQAEAARFEQFASADQAGDDQLRGLYSQLTELGGHDWQLAPWGSEGKFYRFTCRASPTEAAGVDRHFEAVAEDAKSAVEAVLAKLAAWHSPQHLPANPATAPR